ncbi:hypothetical protein OQA88_7864 [Cercophora sp. LCS_1]
MSFVNSSKCPSDPELPPRPAARPRFHHQNTNDRIRESSDRPNSFHIVSKIKKDRKSVFKEIGLDSDEPALSYSSEREFGEITGLAPPRTPPYASASERAAQDTESDDGRSDPDKPLVQEQEQRQDEDESIRSPTSPSSSQKPWYSRLTPTRRPKIRTAATAPPPSMGGLSRLSTLALLIAIVLPGFSYYNGRQTVSLNGADAGVIQQRPKGFGPVLENRADSPIQACKRWSQQTALLNGTLYVYGGQAKTTADQSSDTWNNDFFTLDLTKSWDASTPAFRALTQPSGPPAVANGYLWNDYNNLYLYGGLFSDTPPVDPAPESLWRYNIPSRTWKEFPAPRTSSGNYSDGGDVPVQRSAEGAGISVPELGLSWYFGGHLDLFTTPGWTTESHPVPRIYLKSLLEFTHPGYTNDGVDSLRGGKGAGEGGVYRNITQAGLQTEAKLTERADGVLVFVPGWGEKGVLIGLAGGSLYGDTDERFSQSLSTLDVFDIANSEWYHQQTSGTAPTVRVNPCAVIASAPDASSFNIYLYGGQNLTPYATQYSDMYILSIPSFTWFKVPMSHGPPPRAGHTCNLRDGQIVVVGGFNTTLRCESPSLYVFDASNLIWQTGFNALDHPADLHPENSVLAGSFGYRVPDIVASVIGGDSNGGATVTKPAAGVTGGPFATGKPPVFTITAAGTTATITQWGPSATGPSGDPNSPPSSSETTDRRAGLIAAGVIAGLLGLLALYLGYCAWLYRRQVRAYRSHLAVANRYSASATSGLGGLAAFFGRRTSSHRSGQDITAAAANEKRGRAHRRDPSTSTTDSVGRGGIPPTEPKLVLDDEPTPESGYGSSSLSPHTSTGGAPCPPRPAGWRSMHGESSGSGSGTGTGTTPGSRPTPTSEGAVVGGGDLRRGGGGGSTSSAERLLDGQEPSFFSVVMKPRRALRVVNGLEGEMEQREGGE